MSRKRKYKYQYQYKKVLHKRVKHNSWTQTFFHPIFNSRIYKRKKGDLSIGTLDMFSYNSGFYGYGFKYKNKLSRLNYVASFVIDLCNRFLFLHNYIKSYKHKNNTNKLLRDIRYIFYKSRRRYSNSIYYKYKKSRYDKYFSSNDYFLFSRIFYICFYMFEHYVCDLLLIKCLYFFYISRFSISFSIFLIKNRLMHKNIKFRVVFFQTYFSNLYIYFFFSLLYIRLCFLFFSSFFFFYIFNFFSFFSVKLGMLFFSLHSYFFLYISFFFKFLSIYNYIFYVFFIFFFYFFYFFFFFFRRFFFSLNKYDISISTLTNTSIYNNFFFQNRFFFSNSLNKRYEYNFYNNSSFLSSSAIFCFKKKKIFKYAFFSGRFKFKSKHKQFKRKQSCMFYSSLFQLSFLRNIRFFFTFSFSFFFLNYSMFIFYKLFFYLYDNKFIKSDFFFNFLRRSNRINIQDEISRHSKGFLISLFLRKLRSFFFSNKFFFFPIVKKYDIRKGIYKLILAFFFRYPSMKVSLSKIRWYIWRRFHFTRYKSNKIKRKFGWFQKRYFYHVFKNHNHNKKFHFNNKMLKYSFFFFLNFDISFFDFFSLCNKVHNINGTFYDVFLLFEMSIFNFLSQNFFSSFNSARIFINNNIFIFDLNSRYNSLFIGDIVEFRESNLKSCYVDSYILFFNIVLFCKFSFLRELFYKQILFFLIPFFLKRKIKKSIRRSFLFYPRWFFNYTSTKYLFRPLHYYFCSLIYKQYMPWFSFSLSSFSSLNKNFVSFIHKLERTHKFYFTSVFGYISVNMSFSFFTNWQLNFFSKLLKFFFLPVLVGSWSISYCSELFIRSFFSIRLFNSFTYSSNKSNKHLVTFFSNKILDFRNLSKFYRSYFNREIYFISHDNISGYLRKREFFERYNLDQCKKNMEFAEKKRNLNLDRYEIELEKKKRKLEVIEKMAPNNKFKSLPYFLYSFYWRVFSNLSISTDILNVNFSRRFFILYSSFALLYKRFFDNSIRNNKNYSSSLLDHFLNYKVAHSQLFQHFFRFNNKRFILFNLNNNVLKLKSYKKMVSLRHDIPPTFVNKPLNKIRVLRVVRLHKRNFSFLHRLRRLRFWKMVEKKKKIVAFTSILGRSRLGLPKPLRSYFNLNRLTRRMLAKAVIPIDSANMLSRESIISSFVLSKVNANVSPTYWLRSYMRSYYNQLYALKRTWYGKRSEELVKLFNKRRSIKRSPLSFLSFFYDLCELYKYDYKSLFFDHGHYFQAFLSSFYAEIKRAYKLAFSQYKRKRKLRRIQFHSYINSVIKKVKENKELENTKKVAEVAEVSNYFRYKYALRRRDQSWPNYLFSDFAYENWNNRKYRQWKRLFPTFFRFGSNSIAFGSIFRNKLFRIFRGIFNYNFNFKTYFPYSGNGLMKLFTSVPPYKSWRLKKLFRGRRFRRRRHTFSFRGKRFRNILFSKNVRDRWKGNWFFKSTKYLMYFPIFSHYMYRSYSIPNSVNVVNYNCFFSNKVSDINFFLVRFFFSNLQNPINICYFFFSCSLFFYFEICFFFVCFKKMLFFFIYNSYYKYKFSFFFFLGVHYVIFISFFFSENSIILLYNNKCTFFSFNAIAE